MKKVDNKNLKSLVNFIYEVGILNRTPRSGFWLLGSGDQSVAEHLLRVIFIGYTLSYLVPKVDKNRVILQCLIHDLGEGRTSDLNYAHQKYGRLAETQAIEDIAKSLPFGEEIKNVYQEFNEKKSLEAKLAKDADQLEWITTLREEETKGNIKAHAWIMIAYKRLKTPEAKKLGKLLIKTHPDDWWFDEKDKWYISRNPKLRRWKNR